MSELDDLINRIEMLENSKTDIDKQIAELEKQAEPFRQTKYEKQLNEIGLSIKKMYKLKQGYDEWYLGLFPQWRGSRLLISEKYNYAIQVEYIQEWNNEIRFKTYSSNSGACLRGSVPREFLVAY